LTTRHVLRGILFDFKNGNLVGCDGKRLHCAHLWEPSKVSQVLVPPAAFDLDNPTHLSIPKAEEDLVRQAFLLVENGYSGTSTIEGDSPDYLAVCRKEHHLTAVLERSELADAIEQSLPAAGERNPACTLHLNEHFEICAESKETGAAYVNEVPAELDGKELRVHVNPHQLLATLRTMHADLVTIKLRKPDEALHILSDAGDQWALIMPVTTEAKPSASTTPKH